MSCSILRGIYRQIVTLHDVELRFDCAGLQKMGPASLAASMLRGSYHKIMMLYDVEVRFGNIAQDAVCLVFGKCAPRFASDVEEFAAGNRYRNLQ